MRTTGERAEEQRSEERAQAFPCAQDSGYSRVYKLTHKGRAVINTRTTRARLHKLPAKEEEQEMRA